MTADTANNPRSCFDLDSQSAALLATTASPITQTTDCRADLRSQPSLLLSPALQADISPTVSLLHRTLRWLPCPSQHPSPTLPLPSSLWYAAACSECGILGACQTISALTCRCVCYLSLQQVAAAGGPQRRSAMQHMMETSTCSTGAAADSPPSSCPLCAACRRRAAGPSEGSSRPTGGAENAGMLRFYTDDAPGLKMSARRQSSRSSQPPHCLGCTDTDTPPSVSVSVPVPLPPSCQRPHHRARPLSAVHWLCRPAAHLGKVVEMRTELRGAQAASEGGREGAGMRLMRGRMQRL